MQKWVVYISRGILNRYDCIHTGPTCPHVTPGNADFAEYFPDRETADTCVALLKLERPCLRLAWDKS